MFSFDSQRWYAFWQKTDILFSGVKKIDCTCDSMHPSIQTNRMSRWIGTPDISFSLGPYKIWQWSIIKNKTKQNKTKQNKNKKQKPVYYLLQKEKQPIKSSFFHFLSKRISCCFGIEKKHHFCLWSMNYYSPLAPASRHKLAYSSSCASLLALTPVLERVL